MKGRRLDSLVEEFVTLLYVHNWEFVEADNAKEWYEGLMERDALRLIMTELKERGITEYELKTIYNEYAPEKYRYKGL